MSRSKAERQTQHVPDSQFIEEQDGKKKKGKGSEKPNKHQLFLNRVQGMSEEDVFTPRCEALMKLYQDIQTMYPGEKIIIWSRFYKGLAIIAEAFRRRHDITVPIDSGLLDTDHRDNMLYKWQSSHLTSSKLPICFKAKGRRHWTHCECSLSGHLLRALAEQSGY